jgi:membrane-bound lytic murein transglycosylase D
MISVSCSVQKKQLDSNKEIEGKQTNNPSSVVNKDTVSTKAAEPKPEISIEKEIYRKKIDVRKNFYDQAGFEAYVSSVDSMYNELLIRNNWISKDYRDFEDDYRGNELADSVYIDRLSRIPSLLNLSYNDIVKRFINLYAVKKKNQVGTMMGTSELYFPLFEEILDKEGLPQELKFLPIIESALNPKAFSRAGAAGLWQFMYSTGRMYGLKVNSFVDERMDPVKSTYAAVKFLKDLYNIYGDWQLVIAAYNCGPGNVNRAIRRTGNKRNYWDIYYRLPKETRGYVPSFIAAVYSFYYAKQHGIDAKKCELPIAVDTVNLKKPLHFDQICQYLNIDKEQLRRLNPQYRADIIPAYNSTYSVVLPANKVLSFIDMQDQMYAYKSDYYFNLKDKVVSPRDRYQRYAHVTPKNKAKLFYTVKSNDVVGLIADWFDVRTSDLRYWNNIRRNRIRVGQKLVVYVPKSKLSHYKRIAKMSYSQKRAMSGNTVKTASVSNIQKITSADRKKYVIYKIRRGDNLYTIAKRFAGISDKDIIRLNKINNPKALKIGQELKIKLRS